MRGARAFGALVGLTALVAAGAASAGASSAPGTPPQADRGLVDARVCGPPSAGSARCHAHVLARPDGRGGVTPNVTTSPTGLSAAQVKTAYGFPTDAAAGAGKTIAIVDAYDAPNIESDLAVFSSQMGLPPCTTANGCFKKVNQTGGTSYPRKDAGWALEIALDVQWAHAIAPGAKILLVEASSNSFTNLLAAEDYAKKNAQYVSNSWGAGEFSGETSYDSHFVQSGVSFFVSAGDNGTPAEYPSSSKNVISVGGTNLQVDAAGNFLGETGWSDGGGGCSVYETATTPQSGFGGYGQVSCSGKRATPDVSLVADPATGVSVYTTDYTTAGWYVVGGTSASAPMWAARSAVAGALVNSTYVYGNNIAFRDITAGDNGAPCLVGFDLCTGRGSWTGGGTGGSTTTTSSSTTSTTAPTSTTTVPVGAQTVTLTKGGKSKGVTSVTATWHNFTGPVTVARGTLNDTFQSGDSSVTDTWRGSGTVTYTVCDNNGDGPCVSQSITI
jgi:subtilase family serine protease